MGWEDCSAASSPPIPLVELPASIIKEYYVKRGDTALAARIAGIGSPQLDKPVPLSRLVISGLSPKDRFICVRIVHASNLYRAEFSFQNPGHAPTLRVRYASRYWGQLNDRITGALAIRAFASPDGQCDPVQSLLPAIWGEFPPETEGTLLVNGGQADSVRLQAASAASVECSKLDDTLGGHQIAATAFTHACPLKFVGSDCRKEVDLAVQRGIGPKFMEPDRLRLRPLCPRRG